MTKQTKIIIVLAMVIVVLIAACLGILWHFTSNYQSSDNDDYETRIESSDEDEEEEEPQKKKGSSIIIYEVVDEDGKTVKYPSSESMDEIVSILQVRLAGLGYIEAEVSVKDDNRIEIKIPNVENLKELAATLGQTAHLTFEDTEGNVLVDGSMVKSAKHTYGPVDETGMNVSHVMLTFTKEGQKAFASATEQLAARTDGTNQMYICLDGELYSAPTVSHKIDADTCIITGDFTEESATELASVISGGKLPYKLNTIVTETIERIY